MKTRIKISNTEIKELSGAQLFDFPKYATQLINLANRNAQGTRPAVVGQMSELIQEFTGQSISEWENWYLEKDPDAVEKATSNISEMIDNFRYVISKIDSKMIESRVKDLVIIKTFIGLKFQEAILSKAANILKTTYSLSSGDEESKGIDGFIGKLPVSIKPDTYKSKKNLPERIDVKNIYHYKVKDGIKMDFQDII